MFVVNETRSVHTVELTRRIAGRAVFSAGKCGLPAGARFTSARAAPGSARVGRSSPGRARRGPAPGPTCGRAPAGRGRRGGAAVPGTSAGAARSSRWDPAARPMAAPQDPLPTGEDAAAGNRAGGAAGGAVAAAAHGPLPRGRGRRSAGCGPRRPATPLPAPGWGDLRRWLTGAR